MYKKSSLGYSSFLALMLISATVATLLFTSNAKIAEVSANPYVADAMWVEPSTINFSIYEMKVGDRFNVTIWLNVTSDNMFSWQFKLYYNTSQIQATDAGYTAGGESEWATYRTGGGTAAVTPVIRDNYVWFTESCTGDNYVPAGTCATLAWIEFEIIAAPSSGSLESTLDINNTDTWVLNLNLDEIAITKYSAEYSYYFYEDTTPPTIGTPLQEPETNIQPDQPVKVSVNVTDAESGVENVTLYFTNNTEWYSVPMQFNETTGLWEATIPGHPLDTTIKYKIQAYDKEGNYAVNDNMGEYYVYTVVPEFSSTMYVLVILMNTLAIVAVKLRKKFST